MSPRANCVRPLIFSIIAAVGVVSVSQVWSPFYADAKPKNMQLAKAETNHEDPIVEVDTNKGLIKIKIYKKEAPITSANFLDLVNRHFYDGLTFHRYEPGFVIQGGDPRGDGSGNFTDPQTHKDRLIPLEKIRGLNHDCAGMVAMARTNDPNSASCQWYITLAPAGFLDNPPGYAVFGKVVDGLDNALKLRKGDKMVKVFVEK